jgi:hypothetical protein
VNLATRNPNDTKMKIDELTIDELLELGKKIELDPASKEDKEGSIYLFNSKARKKLDKIQRLVVHKVTLERKARGISVNDDGYSGRKKNR